MINIDNKQRKTFKLKTIDYFLYFFIFGGNTLISGSIVHALEFSILNIIVFFVGLTLTISGAYIHEYIFVTKNTNQKFDFRNQLVTLTIAVSSGCIAGGILHWEEGPKFGVFIIVSGFILSIVTSLLYSIKPVKDVLIGYFVKVSMFAGISFVSGTIVHSMNAWFTNYGLISIGIVLTVGSSLINEALFKKRTLKYFIFEALLLLFLTLGIGGITGGILHIQVKLYYSITLLLIGFSISFIAAMFKNEGSLVELRR